MATAAMASLTVAQTFSELKFDRDLKPSAFLGTSLSTSTVSSGYLRVAGAGKQQHSRLASRASAALSVSSKVAGKKEGTGKQKAGGLQGTLKLLFGGRDDDMPAFSLPRDDKLVFVAGGSGRVGSRVVRELVKAGYRVRAGARNVEKLQEVLADVYELQRSDGFWSRIPLLGGKRKALEIIEVDLEDVASIQEAIGASGKVVCSIGAAENDALNLTAPYRIDGQATKNLIRAAVEVEANQFVMVSSLGTGKIGFPASLLNLFWGVLIWKAQAEKALKESGLAFTIVRPGGMERPKDDYKLTHNLRLAPADTLSGGQVSSLQIAELIGSILDNPALSENKVVEAVAETNAPERPIEDMLAELPVVGLTQEQRLAVARQQAEKEALALEAQEQKEAEAAAAEEARAKSAELRAAAAQLEKELQAARQEEEARASEKAAIEKKRRELQSRAEEAAQTARTTRALEKAVEEAASRGKLLSAKEKEEVIAKARAEFTVVGEAPAAAKEVVKAGTQKVKAGAEKVKAAAPSFDGARAAAQQKVSSLLQTDEPATSRAAAEEAAKAARAKMEADAAAAADAREKAAAKAKEEAAKKQAEEEATKAKAAAEADAAAKAQAEAEAKAKTEEEVKAAEAKAALEAKAKAEAEEKAAAEAKAQAEAEAKAQAEAEAKAKAEEEEAARVRAEAEAKAVEEKEAKAREEKAAKAAQEKEREAARAAAKDKAEAEAKSAKQKLEQDAIAAAMAVEKVIKAPAKGFSWPWQKKEVETDAALEGQAVAEASSTDFPPSPTPLSPYTQYEDLKPPTSPTPKPPPAPPAAPPPEASQGASTDFPPSPTPLSPYTQYEELKPPTTPTPKPPPPPEVAAEAAAPFSRTLGGGFRWPWEVAADKAALSPPTALQLLAPLLSQLILRLLQLLLLLLRLLRLLLRSLPLPKPRSPRPP
eukprot:TRINITY_DN23_c0_g1_i2.p1 TRINITY_DN23_c0_g1~~TRINITY_DN23_c0_g1_i2.p1  ORF type:complete len:935 (-),score=345.12 TRINITY_DN23_c0_g1_i2:1871-4675(-)